MLIKAFNGSIQFEEINILEEDLLGGGEIFIGREEDCHIILDSHQVSRYHASITLEENVLLFKVLSDYGGVSFNGTSIEKKQINNQDTFKIFDFEINISDIHSSYSTPVDTSTNSVNEENENSEDDLLEGVKGAEGLDDYLEDAPVMTDTDSSSNVESTDILTRVTNESDDNPGITGSEVTDEEKNEFNEFRSENYDDDYLEDNYSETTDDEVENELEAINDQENSEPIVNDDFNFGDNDEVQEFSSDDEGFDSGFGDDGGEMSDDDGSATQVLSSFANYYLELVGEYAPFDKYQITDLETFIGRDSEKCQIVLDDPEVSKTHAMIRKSLIGCVVEDLNSSNGILFNGERVNKAELTNEDEFLIGDTAFMVRITSDIIEVEKGRLMPVEENQEVEIEEIIEEEVDYDQFGAEEGEFGVEEEKSFIKRIWKDKRKRLYLIVGIVVSLVFLLGDEDTSEVKPDVTTEQKEKVEEKETSEFSPEILEKLEQNYTLALAKSEAGEYYEAKEYIDIVMQIDPEYRDGNAKILEKLIQEGYDKLIKMKEEEQARKEKLERQAKVRELLKKATKAVDDRNAAAARKFFGMIFELDPENPDVTPLKIDIDAWEAEVKRKAQEEQLAKARRTAMVGKLSPGKTLYLKQDWYKAIDKLEKFLQEEGMDEDLIKEATDMLKDSKRKLLQQVNPLLSKARSYRDGQDLKQAYETYDEVLNFEPSNEEALNEKGDIFDLLINRSKKVYREALVAESLSLYPKAKEKFQEVQQISPINSKYYIKATNKLKNYLE